MPTDTQEDAMTFIRAFRRPGNYLPRPGLPWADRLALVARILAGAHIPQGLTRRILKQ